jgi:cytochrome P450
VPPFEFADLGKGLGFLSTLASLVDLTITLWCDTHELTIERTTQQYNTYSFEKLRRRVLGKVFARIKIRISTTLSSPEIPPNRVRPRVQPQRVVTLLLTGS